MSAHKPDRTNRAESVSTLWNRLGLPEVASRPPTSSRAAWEAHLAAEQPAQVGMASAEISRHALFNWLTHRWQSSDDGTWAQQAFAYLYWGEELYLLGRRAHGMGDESRDHLLHDLLAWQGLAAACGETWFSLWVAPHLHNLFASGNVAERDLGFAVDTPARLFTQCLQQTLIQQAWPTDAAVADLGPYAALISTAAQPDRFEAALVDFCDYRIAQCFGYDGMDATKRRRPSQDGSIMDRGGWEQVFPVELFTLKLAYERATGQGLSLDAPHPLLQTPWMVRAFPRLSPMFENEQTQRMHALAQGLNWTLKAPVQSRYIQA
jgi:hypothetical protein